MSKYFETEAEKAFYALSEEKHHEMSRAARELVGIVNDCAPDYNLLRTSSPQPAEFYVAEHNALALTYDLTAHDREVLAEVVQAARAASESLDKHDYVTPVGYRVYIAVSRYYYVTISEMIEQALRPANLSEIGSAQSELWIEYGEWCVRMAAEAESRAAQRPSGKSEW